MSIKRFTIDGFGQVELNHVAFRRDGRIEAQCALDSEVFADVPAENGMLLSVDAANRKIVMPKDGLPVALHYSAEKLYDPQHEGLKDFSVKPGTFLPRMGYIAVGDKFTTNCLCYEDSELTNDEGVITALESLKETPVYGTTSENGAIKLTKTKPESGVALIAVELTTMPDGQPGVKFHVLAA